MLVLKKCTKSSTQKEDSNSTQNSLNIKEGQIKVVQPTAMNILHSLPQQRLHKLGDHLSSADSAKDHSFRLWVYLTYKRFKLQQDQKLILSGCFDQAKDTNPMVIHQNGSLPEPITQYKTNAEEAEMIIWRHALQCGRQHVLVYSPDTDVYVIGLPLIDLSREYIVHINVPHAQDFKYVCLNSLTQALKDDPNLASLPSDLVALNVQMLFTCSGCDYISFFSGYGKTEFINIFYHHASFITGDASKGRLSDCSASSKKRGYLAFLRLIGTIYFKKHYAAFVSLKGTETPQQLLNSTQSNYTSEQVKTWYNDIRAIVS